MTMMVTSYMEELLLGGWHLCFEFTFDKWCELRKALIVDHGNFNVLLTLHLTRCLLWMI